jgi:hypothetical protein
MLAGKTLQLDRVIILWKHSRASFSRRTCTTSPTGLFRNHFSATTFPLVIRNFSVGPAAPTPCTDFMQGRMQTRDQRSAGGRAHYLSFCIKKYFTYYKKKNTREKDLSFFFFFTL